MQVQGRWLHALISVNGLQLDSTDIQLDCIDIQLDSTDIQLDCIDIQLGSTDYSWRFDSTTSNALQDIAIQKTSAYMGV